MRISRDLHDEMGAGLSLILLNVSQTKSMLHDKAKVERSFESIARNTKDLYDSMSNLVWLLKVENQSFESLKIRLREMVSGLLEDSGIEYQIVIPDNSNTLKVKRDAGLHLLLMVRETVNNALKHAKASLIEFVVILSDKEMQITIADNGIGFLKEKTYASGNGLKNLAYRTNLLGGELTIFSAPEKGTSICIKFPNKNVFEK